MTSSDRTAPAPRIEPCGKRIRTYLGGLAVADTTRALMVWEHDRYPVYYIPVADVRTDLLTATDRISRRPLLGDARVLTLTVGGHTAEHAVRQYPDSPVEAIRDHLRFNWAAMDAWYEEDEQVFTHARDPYTRIDILPSSRTVRIELDGTLLALSRSPRLLFETGLPTRYYLPPTDLVLPLFTTSDRITHCPYKGTATYLSAQVGDTLHQDLAWSYPTPLPESQKIAGLVAFYDERVDVFVDDVRQPRPS
ncbi:DUF427 domain-containing protein [Kitasatospora sp. NPDC049285]|uniref:DUF427 domain-containing protein n=1 Tax=Kitasatospora sp. NPDC049285 TaxID=3157096 RepID=UPI0034122A3A